MSWGNKKYFIIFDGECGFCDSVVRFLAENDVNDKFLFVSNLSKTGTELLDKSQIDILLTKKTIVLIIEDKTYIKSKAFIKILRHIPEFYIISCILSFFPNFTLDFIYDVFSRYRRKIFLKKSCSIPVVDVRRKFVTD